jgi:hypothetical protein
MVQRHDDHDDTAKDIDGLYPVAAKGWHRCSGGWLCLKIVNAGKTAGRPDGPVAGII